jgi:hypothetical protein
VVVEVSEFQPFKSRVGVDTVLRLRSPYDAELVGALKAALAAAKQILGSKNVGGWLPDHRVWWVERAAWPYVRDFLEALGHTVSERPAQPSGSAREGLDPPAPVREDERRQPRLAPAWPWRLSSRTAGTVWNARVGWSGSQTVTVWTRS